MSFKRDATSRRHGWRTLGKEGSLEFDYVGVVVQHLEVLDLPDRCERKLRKQG